jgi:hypothetical protein
MYQDYLRRDGFIADCAFIILDILYNCKRFELCKMYKSQVLSASYAATIRRVYGHAITSGQEIIANSLSPELFKHARFLVVLASAASHSYNASSLCAIGFG